VGPQLVKVLNWSRLIAGPSLELPPITFSLFVDHLAKPEHNPDQHKKKIYTVDFLGPHPL